MEKKRLGRVLLDFLVPKLVFWLQKLPGYGTDWTSFKSVIQDFFGNREANNDRHLVDQLIQNYGEVGIND